MSNDPYATDRDYISRTIATVRNHRDADNCWPQWANIFADEIERLRADYDALATDALGLLDLHVSAEVQRETRLRIIDRLVDYGRLTRAAADEVTS